MKNLFLIFLITTLFLPLSLFATENAELPIYTEQQTSFLITAEQPQFIIKLKSNPTTGYSWFLKKYASRYLQALAHRFQGPDTKMLGAPGYELWTFKMKPAAFVVPLRTSLSFAYLRPWEKNEPSPSLVFWISTKGK
ncbi:MAG TPA: protease inhibitor I42 family protein [Gammaproteobacteria bacterium]|nr:protease inhibitor I42 family protein [Gammaproteobacteria bacterium]